MKKIITLLFAFNLIGYSQTKTVEIPTEKRIIEYQFSENGKSYIQLGKVLEMVGTPQEKNLLEFDMDLNKVAEYDLSKIVSNVEGFVSNNGNVKGFYKQGITSFSAYTSYFFNDNKYEDTKDKNPIKEIINIINSENYQVFFGSTENRRNKKIISGEEYSTLAFYRVNNKNFDKKLIKIDFPKQSFMNSKLSYQYVTHTDDKMFFILNELQNDNQKNVCTLVSYDYDGKLIDNIPFVIELENKNFFSPTTNYQKGNRIEVAQGGVLKMLPTDSAFIQIKVDTENNCFYTYGILNTSSERRGGLQKGYFINKFDFSGKMIWKIEQVNRSKKDTQKNFVMDIGHYFTFIDKNQIGYACKKFGTDFTDFLYIDKNSGNVVNQKSIKTSGSTAPFIKISRTSSYESLKNSKLFIDDAKQNKNVRLDTPTIFAIISNSEVEKYINANPESRFTTNISPTGIYIIEERLKENKYNLLKFN